MTYLIDTHRDSPLVVVSFSDNISTRESMEIISQLAQHRRSADKLLVALRFDRQVLAIEHNLLRLMTIQYTHQGRVFSLTDPCVNVVLISEKSSIINQNHALPFDVPVYNSISAALTQLWPVNKIDQTATWTAASKHKPVAETTIFNNKNN